MLQRLIAEAANKPVAFSDDSSVAQTGEQLLRGGRDACPEDDVVHKNWDSMLLFFSFISKN